MPEIKISQIAEDDFKVVKVLDKTGFHKDKDGNLYLIHWKGISQIMVGWDGKISTTTFPLEENTVATKPLPKGTKIEITI